MRSRATGLVFLPLSGPQPIRQMMKKKIREATIPVERYETVRKRITEILEEESLTARDISMALRIPEREVQDHLEHIRKSLNKQNEHLEITPSQCERCGFVYAKRERFSKPGKCPLCHGSLIRPPVFHIVKA